MQKFLLPFKVVNFFTSLEDIDFEEENALKVRYETMVVTLTKILQFNWHF